jgi:superoxide dismutase, Cu-Zn family
MHRFDSFRPRAAVTVLALATAVLAGCATPVAPGATAPIEARSGSKVGGTIRFAQAPGGVRVTAKISGLTPNQEHGFHVHEKGDCSAPDAMSAGGHFNPTAQPHGPQGAPHHGGDMPALKADTTGNVDMTFVMEGVTLGSGPTDLRGKSVIIHAQPDDYTTQPTGNSGGRIGCGVIAG